MLAKCSRCSQTFQTDRYGEQFCPFCGAQVMIAAPAGAAAVPGAPGAPAATGALPPPGAAGAAPGEPHEAPVDNPNANGGWFNAAMATWKQSVFDPNKFFQGLKPGPDAGGAVGYACAVLAVGGLLAGIMGVLQSLAQRAQMEQLHEQLSQMPPEARQFMDAFMKLAEPGIGTVLLTPVMSVIGFFITAGLLHVALMIVGGNKHGFTATLRAVGYAQGPVLFNVVPFCGGMAAWIWVLVLTVMAMAGVHGISIGRSIGAYAVMFFGLCCLCILPVSALVGAGMASALSH
ncbi:MAG: YIP1 family protein [Deltaproteobacteria bacterium]|nr:YIP1 family protein [Deltaproteobacteria bacterium]